MKKSKNRKMAERIAERSPEQFIAEIQRGVDHGLTLFECVWASSNGRYAIFKKRGHMTWSGRGSTRYVPTEHFLFNIQTHPERDDSYELFRDARITSFEGRSSKSKIEELKSHAVDIPVLSLLEKGSK